MTMMYGGTVVVRFKAVGNAPIMKQNFYKITAANRFQAVIQFLRKELGWKAGDPLVRGRFCFLLLVPLYFFSSFDYYRSDGYELTPVSFLLLFCRATNSSHISTWHSHLRQTIQCRTCSRWVYSSVVFSCAKTRAFEQSFATDGHLIVNYRSVTLLLGTSPPFFRRI